MRKMPKCRLNVVPISLNSLPKVEGFCTGLQKISLKNVEYQSFAYSPATKSIYGRPSVYYWGEQPGKWIDSWL